MAQAPRDENRVTTLLGVDNIGFTIPTTVGVNSSTHELLTQSKIVDSSGNAVSGESRFNTNHIDDTTTTNVVYIGMEDKSGIAMIKKIDKTGSFPVFTYATVANNPTLTTYATLWAARATTAVYSQYSTAL